jgi:hypothetical protein
MHAHAILWRPRHMRAHVHCVSPPSAPHACRPHLCAPPPQIGEPAHSTDAAAAASLWLLGSLPPAAAQRLSPACFARAAARGSLPLLQALRAAGWVRD